MSAPGQLYRVIGTEAPPTPVLVVALEGWIDAGLAASTAMTTLVESHDLRRYAVFDSEELLDQRARRPHLKIVDGISTDITWPEIELLVGTDRLGSGIALLTGPEPDLRWRSFGLAVTELATSMHTRLMVGLGGFPAGAPHTRPIKLAATASNEQLASQVGFVSGELEVPAGIQAIVEQSCAAAGISAVGLWARVPHYVAAMPFPAAALALLDGLASISGLVIDSEVLSDAGEAARRKVDQLIAQSAEHLSMVRQLEQHIDDLEGAPTVFEDGFVPSGEEIAAELERYLRGESGEG